jgi:hypothetical protein
MTSTSGWQGKCYMLHKLIELRKQEEVLEEQQRQNENSNGEGNNTTQADQ